MEKKIEPVAFTIYKPTPPHGERDVENGELPWVYDQDPSSGYSASMRVVPEAQLRAARAEDQARIRELTEALHALAFECYDGRSTQEPSIETYNRAFDVLQRHRGTSNYSALNEALAAECERLADNATLLVGIHVSPQERYRLRDSLRERAAAHRAKAEKQ